jgi:hypothetical protein
MDFTVCLINNSSATESAACRSAENYDDLESIESSFSLADFCTPQQNTSFNQIHCLEEPFSTNQNDPLKCFYGDGFTPFSLAEAMCAHQQQKNQLFYGGQNGKHQNWTTNCCRFLPIVQKELVVYEPEEAEVTMPLPAAESEEAPELLSPCSYYSKHSTNSPSMIQTTSASGSGQDNTPEIIDEELLAKQIWKNEQMIQMMSPFQKYRVSPFSWTRYTKWHRH